MQDFLCQVKQVHSVVATVMGFCSMVSVSVVSVIVVIVGIVTWSALSKDSMAMRALVGRVVET